MDNTSIEQAMYNQLLKDEAVKWYRLAAAQGNADAISALQRFGVK